MCKLICFFTLLKLDNEDFSDIAYQLISFFKLSCFLKLVKPTGTKIYKQARLDNLNYDFYSITSSQNFSSKYIIVSHS